MNDYIAGVNHNAFCFTEKNGVKLLTLEKLSEHGFKHCFTTRIGGVSSNEFESLNLSLSREANLNNKIENYKRVCGALDIDYNSLSLVNYEHGASVYILKDGDKNKGISKPTNIPRCDALITNNDKITAVTLHADCVPIFMADIKSGAAGVAHAGWKGTLHGIAFNMVEKFKSGLKSNSRDLIIGIGPHIMTCCFEVKSDVAEKFLGAGLDCAIDNSQDKIYSNLQLALLSQLKRAGIGAQNIYCADMCTYCNKDLFYSHRRDKGHTGAMGSFITARKA